MSLDTSLFERRRPARQRRNSRSPEPRVPAVRQGRTCARNAFGGCPCVCSLVCGRAYAHPNVSAKLPSKGKRVRYLGLARARITRQTCSYAFTHEMHAHLQPPVAPSRLAKKKLHIDLCESGRKACCGQHVCAGTVLVTAYSTRIYPAHLREINAGACACVSMRALCTCARVKGGMAGTYRDVQRCRSSSSRLGHSMPASRTHSAPWPSRMACALLITTVGGALRHPNLRVSKRERHYTILT